MIVNIIQLILGVSFTVLSLANLSGNRNSKEKFKKLNMPIWFMYLTGTIQIIGGITMLVGIWHALVGAFSGFWIAMLMAGAVTVRMKSGERIKDVYLPLMIGFLALLVFLLNIL
ncbi:DoxX family protein [Staphylococcus pasteuri]|uniref:DoxX family protein n=1 Tax=Staphylococcus pasteuri TaxID=45972 RepID=UPI0012B7A063|nr:DoxX family protein [Staphylococcus pasteuri]